MGRWAELGGGDDPTPTEEDLRREVQLRRPVTEMQFNMLAADVAQVQATLAEVVRVNNRLSQRILQLEQQLRERR